MSARSERVRELARRQASRHPAKSAKSIADTRRQAADARARGDELEADRLEAVAGGYEDELRTQNRCLACGKTISNRRQPGFAVGLGPECYGKSEP